MYTNRFLVAFSFAGLLSLAACGGEEAEIQEEPVIEEPAPAVEPAPAPMTTDTASMPMNQNQGNMENMGEGQMQHDTGSATGSTGGM